MWFLCDRNCNSNKSEAWETELVHQNGNREVICWLLFPPDSPFPSCLEPSITSSVHSNVKSLSSPSPGGSSSPFTQVSMYCCSGAAVSTSNWTLPPISPHHPKMRSSLTGRKTRSESWIHCSLFFGVKSELSGTLARSFRDGPSFPSSLVSVTFKCDALTYWTERENLCFYTSMHFIFLSLLFLLAHLLLLETFFFTMTHSVMLLTTSTDLWITLDWNHLIGCLLPL